MPSVTNSSSVGCMLYAAFARGKATPLEDPTHMHRWVECQMEPVLFVVVPLPEETDKSAAMSCSQELTQVFVN